MNAKDELIKHIGQVLNNHYLRFTEIKDYLVCANILICSKRQVLLKPDYREKDYYTFLDKLNFSYENSWGPQTIKGILLFKDSYSDRFYDFVETEWWINHKIPSVEQVMNFEA